MMAVSEREFGELRTDVRHLDEKFEEFRDEVRGKLTELLDAEQVRREASAEARGKLDLAKRIGLWVMGVGGTAAAGVGALIWQFAPTIVEWWFKTR